MNNLHHLKKVDIFKQLVFIYSTSRNKKTNVINHNVYHGSIPGGFLTFICGATILYYTVTELKVMNSGLYDNFNLQVKTNPGTGDLLETYINETSFYPVFDLYSTSNW